MKRSYVIFSLFFLWSIFTNLSYSQWSQDPLINNPVCVNTDAKSQPLMTDNGDGGTIVAWLVNGGHPGAFLIYAQNLDADGNPLWPAGGVLVTPPVSHYSREMLKVISDGKKGAIISWYQTNTPGLTRTLMVQRIAPDGTLLWGTGVDVALPMPEVWTLQADITTDNNAGVIAVWAICGDHLWIHTAKIDSSGAQAWSTFDTFNTNDYSTCGYPVIADDGMGGAFIAWEDFRYSSHDVFAQYFDYTGAKKWDPFGRRVSANLPPFSECKPMITCRTAPTIQGPIIVWKGTTPFSTSIYAQQLFINTGTLMWPDPLVHTLIFNLPDPIAICNTWEAGVAIAWFDGLVIGKTLLMKSMDDGSLVWGTDPLFIASGTGDRTNVALTPSGYNYSGVIATWQDSRNGNADIYAQYIAQGGTVKWTPYGIPVSLAANEQSRPAIISDGTTRAYLAWQDSRNGTNYDIYAARIPVFASPDLAVPADNAVDVSVSPVFKWYKVSGTMDYSLQLATDSAFSSLVLDWEISDSVFTYPALLANNTRYYWRAAALGGEYSPARSFTTYPSVIPYLNYPTNNATVYTLTPTLSWNLNLYPPGIKFDVFLSTDSLFESGTTISDADSALQFTPAPLLPTTHYYWKVRTRTAAGAIISYSDRQDFTTYGTLVAPTPSWPIGGALVYTNDPVLNWYMGTPLYSYTYEVRYKASSSGLWSAPIPAGGDLNIQLSGLTPGTAYDWAVRSYNGSAYSDWSVTQTFSTYTSGGGSPPLPVLSYPVSGVTVYSVSPMLYWYISMSTAGIEYSIKVSKYSNFSSTVVDSAGVLDLYLQLSGLEPGTMYYWKVQSFNGSAYSSWTAPDSFYTYNISGNLTPVLSYPVGGATVYTSTPYVYWYTLGGIAGSTYEIQYALNEPVFTETLTSPTTYCELPALQYGGKYFWRVRSLEGSVTSPWSGVDSFEVTGATGSLTPIPTWPVGGAIVYTPPAIIYWYINGGSGIPLTYDIEYNTDNNFSGTPSVSGITTTFYQIDDLIPGQTYFYKLRTYNGNAYSNWSSAESFITPAGDAPAAPVVGSPKNNVFITSNAPVLSWFIPVPMNHMMKYEVLIADNQGMNNAQSFTNLSSLTIPVNGLDPHKTYYWKVRSVNNDGSHSLYSPIAKFRTESVTDVNPPSDLPKEFSLSQNYPNPFNPSTTIRFTLPKQSDVRLAVYDMLGSEIALLASGAMNAGSYSVSFNGSNLASGIYLYRLTAGTQIITKKLILMK